MRRSRFLHFADADADIDEAEFVLMGVPFDATSSYRAGSRFGPNAIREASYNFETYLFEHDLDISEIPVFDSGNLEDTGRVEDMIDAVRFEIGRIIGKDAFPLVLGGEHSVTPPCVEGVASSVEGDLGVLVLDAHLDFRDHYLGVDHSHACSVRRISDIVGVDNVAVIGVRSMSKEERVDASEAGLRYFTATDVLENGIGETVREALDHIGKDSIYVSVDIDGLDPAYAPAVGNPEPFGLTDRDLKELLYIAATDMKGFDLVEVCPAYDKGNTAALAARLVREVIALKKKVTS